MSRWGLALIVYLIFSSISNDENSWRILFVIGALPTLFIFYVLRQVKEPEIWLQTMEMKRKLRQEKIREGNEESLGHKILSLTFFQLWAPDLIVRTLLGLLLSTGALFGYYSIFTFLPTYLQKVRHLTAVGSGPYLAMVVIGSFIGYLSSGWINDK
jgi:sugar phosphate permease